MQGYRGNNRQRWWVTYLTVALLTCLPQLTNAQRVDRDALDALTWYVPRNAFNAPTTDSPYIITYSSLTDLAEKLASRPDEPYHLSLRLGTHTAADWKRLRDIPPATSLAIDLADSVMSDSLLPILATWPTLKKIAISAIITGSRPFTVVTNRKGEETIVGDVPSQRKIAQTGWKQLRSLQDVQLIGLVDLQQAITALQDAPALESLSVQYFSSGRYANAVVPLAGMRRLKRVSLTGASWADSKAFSDMPALTSLTLFDPDMAKLNDAMRYLASLRELSVSTFSQSAQLSRLRLGKLANLHTLSLRIRPQPPMSLDSAFAGLTTLRSLTLEQVKLASFPSGLLANPGLTYLAMPDAGLGALPEGIDQLASLEELILDNNPLNRLPDAIARLSHLRRLSVNRCELVSLPASIGQLTSLTGLSLTGNQLTQLPASMGQLKKLRQLNVAMNQLGQLPEELGTLPKLETIVAFWNKIARFPAGLTQVRELYLTDNQLTQLPDALGTLTHLRTLLLDNNPLTSLPESIGQLDSLETLVLGRNQLTRLPKTLGSLRRLSRLTLGQNQVRDLPETIGGLTSLTSVSLTDMPIYQLPAAIGGWTRLKTVQLKLSQLQSVPRQLSHWQALETLTIDSDNLLVIPDEVTDCPHLSELLVAGKRLVGLPETLGKLTRLSRLTVDGRADSLTGQGRGQVMVLPASTASCKALTSLAVINQQQFDVLEGMQLAANLPQLKHLLFINCGITELAGIPWKKLPASTLNLSQNRFSQLPVAVLEMPNLEQANFSETNLPARQNQLFFTKMGLAEALKQERE